MPPAPTRKSGLTASWELDLWGRVRRSVEASEATAESTADDLAAATLSLQAQLAQSYFLLRVQDAETRLLQDSVARYERSLQLTRNQYDAGIVSRGDVVQAEAQLMSTRSQALEADLNRTQLEHAIAILIGKPPADLSIAATVASMEVPAIPSSLPSELLIRRPDIAAAERRMAAANAQIGVAQADFYPSARLFAGGGIDISFAGGYRARAIHFRRRIAGSDESTSHRGLRGDRRRFTGRRCSGRCATSRTTWPRSASSPRRPRCRAPRSRRRAIR